jgi:diguanylate cyclase (GGDEF)-like protein
LLLLDIASIAIIEKTGSLAVQLNRVINVLGFSLGPIVPYIIYFFIIASAPKIRFHLLLALPLAINALLSISSYQTGWLFFVDAQNIYSRGPLFLINPITSLLYFFIDIYASIHFRGHDQKKPSFYLILLYCLPLVAVTLQYLFPEVLIIWGSVSLVLLMYYVYTLEKHFSFDVLTKVENRESFEMKMHSFKRNVKKDATLFVFDLNNLKKTNDTYGHAKGDEMLRSVSNLLLFCFGKNGNIYRIGGDEFCVITKAMPDSEAKKYLSRLQERLNQENKKTPLCPLIVAYGFSTSNSKFGFGIDESFAKADNLMYEHKFQIKKNNQL